MIYTELVGTFRVLTDRFLQKRRREGLFAATWYTFCLFVSVVLYPLYRFTRGRQTFSFRGRTYSYFCHWYNTTYNNERALEVAVMLDMVNAVAARNGSILEIGNVLSHYANVCHDVLDKYEKGTNVIHEDVVTYAPQKTYDLICSISTIEHVGWDEDPKDSLKIVRALQNLKQLLSPGGMLIVSVPIQYNPHMDELIASNAFLPEQHFFKRVSLSNIWKPVQKKEALSSMYNEPYPFGNAITIGVFEKDG
ncbi:hypothetical protein A2424_02845 [Candidatus Peribacteria bacterium RIFOXYC1_FULL_54_13]|nr:MAG: hypothetical protein A2198_01575 [Candidatus Peribacteria bacterium RIFOXYA1_FULL_56_14]OGJ74937.1 MAG: hypothetical protein A2217_02990 [Candidatus Peribacteria bacterium RIFOXYA2_FULL_55_28]OGJ77225.1 MAG: hypothetical protein A2327_06095 [Candidatus Peribacteria bacterium RIFOXYB2_FULL_54_17]OGJ79123.1 MAG: hypothetical protein A2424_02845 [Candidatus Peribacteria bacterium RIFOXYC1_FULL_54_13]OGJ82641.1 MAG: hypothetical protein A2598_01530 [Candidatus Peribacteria bacterium RIFOXYD